MLNLAGRPPVVQAFPNESHTLQNPKVLDIAGTGITGFLQRHLGPSGAGDGAVSQRRDDAGEAPAN